MTHKTTLALIMGGDRRYWIARRTAEGSICEREVDTEQVSAGVEIALQMSHNTLTSVEEYVQ